VKNLVFDLYNSLRKNSSDICVTDYSLDKPIKITKKQILILATALSKEINKNTNSNRVGIVIPNSGLGIIANIAVILSGKVPVNLNFASTNDVARHCIAKSGINLLLTASALRRKFSDFPFSDNSIDCDTLLKKIKCCKFTLIKNYIIHSLPKFISRKILKIEKEPYKEEFAVLFTSGSNGAPKGVALSHLNILSNIDGISEMQKFPKESKILANLPLFHSFGFTVTMWLPLLKGIPIVTVPSPLEINKNITAIEREQITILLGTPTFLRGFLRKGSSNKFKSLQYVVAGAEKSDINFIRQWENIAECKYLEGYGLTETSPVLSLNTTDCGIKHGSVGKLLPHVVMKTIHPETKENLGRHDSGLLCFRGRNIFIEYIMDAQKTKDCFVDGWFISGDIGYLDSEGFLHLQGRLSRFSKIGGEMIPHETIEETAIDLLNWNVLEGDERLVILSRPHETKGEELILVTNKPINFDFLRKELATRLGNLFVPKKQKLVEKIPILPSGKVDFQELYKEIS
jgi:acyl-[acyl-carrier-protein]-phospholipid O-acyltransferase/long-chain-fatty-acid--[acyl-carrier-protein] ligase